MFTGFLSSVASTAAKGVGELGKITKKYADMAKATASRLPYKMAIVECNLYNVIPASQLNVFIQENLADNVMPMKKSGLFTTGVESIFEKEDIVFLVKDQDMYKLARDNGFDNIITSEKLRSMMARRKLSENIGDCLKGGAEVIKAKASEGNLARKKLKIFIDACKTVTLPEVQDAFRITDNAQGYAQYIDLVIAKAMNDSGYFGNNKWVDVSNGHVFTKDVLVDMQKEIQEAWDSGRNLEFSVVASIKKDLKEVKDIIKDMLKCTDETLEDPDFYSFIEDEEEPGCVGNSSDEEDPKSVKENSEEELLRPINTAKTVDELVKFPGIGKKRAELILNFIEVDPVRHFTSFDELINILKMNNSEQISALYTFLNSKNP